MNRLGGVPIAEIAAGGAPSYTDNVPLAGTNRYAISAVNDAGEGARSAQKARR